MTLTNLYAKTRRLLGNITTTELPDATSLISINEYYHKAIAIAMRTMGEWEINAFEGTADLVADQKDYAIPADILRIYRIEANYSGATDGWEKLRILDQSELDSAISNTNVLTDNYIRMYSDHVELLSAPTANVTDGLKMFYSDKITELSTGTDEPNIPEHIVSYLYYGSCLDYCIENKINDQISYFEGKLKQDEQNILEHYSRRLPARRPSLKRKKINFK